MRLSVVTPVLNGERFIADAIKSVALQQSPWEKIEHIIVDGGSTDKTQPIIQKFSQTHNVALIEDKGSSQSEALNTGFQRAAGDWIAWLNSDEFYLRDSFLYLYQLVSVQSQIDMIYGESVIVDENGRKLRLKGQHGFDLKILRDMGCYIASCASFFNAEAVRDWRFDPQLRRIMDWDLFLRLSNEGKQIRFLPAALSAFRLHNNQVTAQPAQWDSPEHVLVRSRHGLTLDSQSAKWRYVVARARRVRRKVVSGGYWREAKFYWTRRSSMRWFDN